MKGSLAIASKMNFEANRDTEREMEDVMNTGEASFYVFQKDAARWIFAIVTRVVE
jgi:hypothetical protein